MADLNEPTKEERAALERYAFTHGGRWKRQLLDDWTNGRATGELQVIRNSRGPSWLLQHFFIARKPKAR